MIKAALDERAAQGRLVRVGVSGAGWIGSGFVAQVAHMQGIVVNVLADADIRPACQAFLATGVSPSDVVECSTVGAAMDALHRGQRVITGDYTLAAQLEDVDIVADITPSPAIGAQTAYACIRNGKDIVLVNIEADVTVGCNLKRLAREAGILYTVSSGDEPGCLAELWEFVTTLGYEPMVIGKGKYYTFFRPYHVWFLEAPISVARAHIFRRPWLVPLDRPVADVMTVAKRVLRPGERLDDFGGYMFYGVIDRVPAARGLDALPVGPAPGAVVTRPVAAGAIIAWADVTLDETSDVVTLRQQKDASVV